MMRSQSRGLLLLLMLGLFIAAVSVHAQDLPTNDTPPSDVVLPTEEPTLALPAPALPTEEPVSEQTAVLTEEPTTPPTESTPVESETPVTPDAVETDAPQEPTATPVALPLSYSANFDAGYPAELSTAANWMSVDVAGGSALQAFVNAAAITYTADSFNDAAVEARFLLNAGEGRVTLGTYAARLNSTGLVTLSQGDTALATAQAALTAGEWVKVRLQISGGQIRVSLNDSAVIEAQGIAAEGFAGFAASTDASLRVDDFAVYGTPMTVYAPSAPETPVSTVEPTVAPIDATPEQQTSAAGKPSLSGASPLPGVGSILMYTGNSTATKVILTWNDNLTTETSYKVLSSLDQITWVVAATFPANTYRYESPVLTCGDSRYWRVQAFDNASVLLATSGDGSVSTAACTTGTLISPDDNMTYVDSLPPLLIWGVQTLARYYEVDLSTTADFTTPISGYPQQTTSSRNFYQPSALLAGTYYWRARVKEFTNGSQGTWSDTRTFVIDNVDAPASFAQSATVYTDHISLQWADAANEEGYLIEQSSDGTTWTTLTTTAADVTSYDITGLECGYLTRLRIRSFTNTPSYRLSFIRMLTGTSATTTPCEITLIGPDNGVTLNGINPTFSWEPAPNATSYQLLIGGTSVILSGTSYTYTGLTNNTTGLQWQVHVLAPVWGPYTTMRTINVQGLPNPVKPTSFTVTEYYDKLTFAWPDVSGEGGYVIEQSTDSNTWTETVRLPANTTTYTGMTTPDSCGKNYYYQIRALTTASPDTYLQPRGVGIRKGVICPTAQAPNDNMVRTSNTPQFVWTRMTDVTHYMLDLSTSPTFETSLPGFPAVIPPNPNQSGSSVSYNLPEALPNGVYYWRVRNHLPAAYVSFYSQPMVFTINIPFIPDTPVPLYPNTSSVLRTTRPTFVWQPVPGALIYYLEVDDDPNFKSAASISTGQTSVSTAGGVFSDFTQGVLYWRVRSMARVREVPTLDSFSQWSTPKQFSLNPALTPADNAVVSTTGTKATVAFTWTSVPDSMFPLTPPMYTVEVSNDPQMPFAWYTCVSNLATVRTCSIPNIPIGIYYWRVVRNGEGPLTTPVSNRFVVSPPAVRAPTLLSPTAAKVLQPLERPNVVLDWSWGTLAAPVGTYTYDVVISTNNMFTVEPTDSATGLNDSTYTTSALPNGVYYWRARAVNTYGAPGVWSAPFSFTVDSVAPDAPVIKTPALNAILPTARPTFTWAASVGASRYVLEVHATACDDGTVLYISPSITTLAFAIPAPAALSQGPQVVCIKAYDAAGNEGSFGEARAFTVFLGLTPAVNAFVPLTTKPTFTWTVTTGTTAYTLEVDNDPAFDGTVDSFPTMTVPLGNVAKYILPNTLPEGTYYWRVVRGGETLTSNVSRTFYVGALLAGPTLTEPTAGQSIKLPTMLRWAAASAPTGAAVTAYQVEISKVATFVPLAVPSVTITLPSTLETQFTPPAAQNAVRYYWRVRGLVNGSPVTNWSSSNVLVDNVPPGLPTVASPAANALLNTVRPAITWAPVAGATRYTVAIKDTVADVDVVPEQSVTGTSLVLTQNLPQSELVLRVRAEDTINSGDWRSVNFKVRLGTLPMQNAIVTSNRPAFTWLAVPTATAYTLQVDNDPLFDNTVDTFPTLTIPLGNVLTYTLNANQPLPANGVYYWRVKTDLVGVDYPANTGSRSFYFTTPTATKPMGLASLAAATASVSVFNKATYQAGGVTLSWNNVTPKPSLYEVEVSTAATFAPTGTTQHTAAVSAVQTSTLLLTGNQLTDGLKYWRVRAVYSADRTSYGLWSDVKQFTLDQVPPLPPIIPATVSQYSTANRPTFIWTASATAARYYLTVQGTSINGLQVVGTSYKAPLTALPLAQNSDEGYTWFVEAEDLAGNRSAIAFSVMYIFVGTSPKDEQFLTDTTPAFTWTPVTGPGAATWTLEISHDVDMTDNVYTASGIAANLGTFTMPNGNSLQTGVYYWRVYRQGEDLTHLLGSPFYIVPNVTAATAMPEYPYNGMTLGVNDLDPFLYVQWRNLAPQPDSLIFSKAYLFEISTNSTFTGLVDFRIVPVTSSDESSAMYWEDMAVVDGKQYYWRVRGIFGKTAEELGPNPALEDFLGLDVGPTGGIYTFKVDLTAPGTPTQTLPIVHALVTTRTPTFVWTAAPLVPARYRVEIALDSGFTTILQSTTTTTPALTLTLPAYQSLANGAYYWRVVAIDLADNEGVPSAGRRFVVAAP